MDELRSELVGIVGQEHVLTDPEDRAFYSQDIYSSGELAGLVARPGGVAELAAVTAAATTAGVSVSARGGGTSYTGGFLPDRTESLIIDLERLDRIVEVNEEDMYVTVEGGCTWKALHEELAPRGLRTPFWGPLSGRTATVGGSLSQNAVLWGSARHGVSSESVLALEVVLADGTIVATGSASTRGGKPFFRHYGPDLTGLFLGDTGALGIKARATLRLIPRPAEERFASFSFASREELAAAMTAIARAGLASECFGLDPVLKNQRLKRESLGKDLKSLKGVMTGAGGLGSGMKQAAKVVLAGRDFIGETDYSLHIVVEGRSGAAADADLEEVRRLCGQWGEEVADTIPRVMRGDPFAITMTSAIGPRGERWAPVHGIVPLSEAVATWASVADLLAEYDERFARLDIVVGFLLAVVGGAGFIIEPVFYWPGPRPLYYERVLEPGYLSKLDNYEESPETAATVAEVRSRLARLFLERRAAHFQIGRTYLYRDGRRPETWKLLEQLKQAVDPTGLMNPGSLGL